VLFIEALTLGQKRRLSLGLALIKKPLIMLLDEPTSGLDSASSFGVLKLLSSLAKDKGQSLSLSERSVAKLLLIMRT
jgi:ABC-type multidrug transport system ATPase subunit